MPRFVESMAFLFPEVVEDPGSAMDLAGRPVELRRRIEGAVAQAEADLEGGRGKSGGAGRRGRT